MTGLIDAGGAAEMLGVPKSWVLAEARADRIPHVRLGRYVRFEPAELEAWWQARRRGPHAREARTMPATRECRRTVGTGPAAAQTREMPR